MIIWQKSKINQKIIFRQHHTYQSDLRGEDFNEKRVNNRQIKGKKRLEARLKDRERLPKL